MNPNKKQRVGYLVYFQGLNMNEFLNQDVEVLTPLHPPRRRRSTRR